MLNFEDIEELVDYMFENLDDKDNIISVIANKDMILNIMHELCNYNNVIINTCDIEDKFDYDKEYRLSLYDDVDEENWYVDIIPIYDAIDNRYSASDGFTLFHEDVNSKAMIDMQNSKVFPLEDHDWFTIGEVESEDIAEDDTDEETDLDDDDHEDESDDSDYSVTIKVGLDSKEAEDIIHDMKKNFQREFSDMFDMLYRPYLYEYRPNPIRFFW